MTNPSDDTIADAFGLGTEPGGLVGRRFVLLNPGDVILEGDEFRWG